MHVKSQRVFTRLTQLKELILESDLFIAEYNLDNIQFVQHAEDLLIPDGKSLSDLIGEKKFRKIHKIIEKSFKVDLRQFEYYLPLLIVNIIGEAILTKDYHLPLDIFLWNFAKESEKELDGVETYASQQQIMQAIKMKDQLKMVKDISKRPYIYRKNILKMAKWYEEESINLLYKNGKKSLGKYKHILLKKRNFIMADRFEELTLNQKSFMAVGAGHLAGQHGILKLLKDKGWKLKAI
ncbi:conjugative transfer protein GumN [Portibacter lacus]|uniref:Conjugative transfer protein GumN n=2 Tax=Portibacter lacus TaxID=1099794 RepID=A0AA37SPD1_9BACT|nr:conjugative transfer protein GumN [Portibacter lacus]